jgi:hypothetical protein
MIFAFSLGERVVNHLARRCEGGCVSFGPGVSWVGDENAPLCPAGRAELDSWQGLVSGVNCRTGENSLDRHGDGDVKRRDGKRCQGG